MILLFLVYWLFTSSITFTDFMQLPNEQSMGSAVFIFVGIAALSGTVLALNIMVLLNAKFNWVSNEQLKTKIGKDISRYVHFPST